jgi:hypothetical protein
MRIPNRTSKLNLLSYLCGLVGRSVGRSVGRGGFRSLSCCDIFRHRLLYIIILLWIPYQPVRADKDLKP